MKYPHIAAMIYGEPWMMRPQEFQILCSVFEDVNTVGKADDPVGPVVKNIWTGKQEHAHQQIEVIDGVALARVYGATGRRLSTLDMQCGGFDTGLFRQQLENIAGDAAVKCLVIDFDSPGGMVAGNARAVHAIREVAESGKRVIGYTSGLCCSCAYWMACACDEFHADGEAQIGSISTITSGIDSSERWKQMGMELKLFATGKYKATGMPGKKWTEDEEKMIWDRINKLDAEFKGFVKKRRGLSDEEMQGQWWYAKHAPAGLVDSTKFESLEEVVEAALVLAAK